jgi:hypothetical protein
MIRRELVEKASLDALNSVYNKASVQMHVHITSTVHDYKAFIVFTLLVVGQCF